MTKNEEPLAGMVSADDLSHQDHMDGERTDRFSIIDEIRAEFADTPTEEIEREAARSIAEVREEMRRETRDSATCP